MLPLILLPWLDKRMKIRGNPAENLHKTAIFNRKTSDMLLYQCYYGKIEV
tara:strand:+ start:3756 stop:3905 length:150 start_codon:yes stop_codon:yes gene_type:complete